MDQNKKRADLTAEVFRRVNRSGLDYALLRNYREVSSGTAKDADILVTPRDLPRFAARIGEAVRETPDWEVIQVIRSRYGKRVIVLHRDLYSLRFDLQTTVRLESGPAPARLFLADAELSPAGIRLLTRERFLLCLYLHRLVKPKPEYELLLAAAFQAEDGLEEGIEAEALRLNRRYRDRRFRRVFRKIFDCGFWRSYLAPPGLFVVVNGPDGVGKTTALAELQVRLFSLGIHSRIKHLGGKTGMLPERPSGFGKNRGPSRGSPPRSGAPPRSRVLFDLPRLIYHYLDVQLYYWMVIRKTRAAGGWFIADKYFTYTIKARSMGFTVPGRLPGMIYRLLPRPDLFILFWNDPEEIARRKGELTPEEAKIHSRLLEGLSRHSRRREAVKTDRPIPWVAGKVLELLFDSARERFGR